MFLKQVGNELQGLMNDMKILQKICFVLLLTTFSSVYAGDYFKDDDVDDCRVRAEQGDSEEQFVLGVMYESAFQNVKEAFKWYRKSAEQGHAQAQNNLGDMYSQGRGVLQDDKESVKWYRKSAEQGNAEAQNNLGDMY